jgi:hypothetical protein
MTSGTVNNLMLSLINQFGERNTSHCPKLILDSADDETVKIFEDIQTIK